MEHNKTTWLYTIPLYSFNRQFEAISITGFSTISLYIVKKDLANSSQKQKLTSDLQKTK